MIHGELYSLKIKAANKRPNPYASIWNDLNYHFENWYIERFWFSDPLLNLNVLHVAAWRRAFNTFLVPVIIFDQHWPVCRYITTAWSITTISPFTSSVIAVDKFANMLLVYFYYAAAATITPFLAWPLRSCGERGNKAGLRHPAPRLIESRLSAGTCVCRPKVKALLILALRLLPPAPHELFTRIAPETWPADVHINCVRLTHVYINILYWRPFACSVFAPMLCILCFLWAYRLAPHL